MPGRGGTVLLRPNLNMGCPSGSDEQRIGGGVAGALATGGEAAASVALRGRVDGTGGDQADTTL